MTEMTKRAGVYCRISRDRDDTRLGVERQREDCEQLVAASGWTLAGVYVDNDVSAYSGKKRPEYLRLLGDVEAGTVDAIVTWHPDRLHRSPRELEPFIDLVDRSGVEVRTCTAGVYDLTTSTGRMNARIVGAVARQESEHKAERLQRKAQQMAEAGAPSRSGTRAFGLNAEWNAVVPEEAALIRDAEEKIVAGASIRGIASDWNSRGVTTTKGGPWGPGPLKRMLTAGYLAGIREHFGYDHGKRRDEPVRVAPGQWPAILDATTLETVRAILRDPGRRTTTNRARRYLLTGFLTCGNCGKPMRARPRADHVRRYICPKGPMFHGCGTVILAEPLEKLVTETILEYLDEPELTSALQHDTAHDDEAVILAAINADTAAMDQLTRDAYVDRVISRADYFTARDPLVRRIEENQSRLAATSKVLASVVGGARDQWDKIGFDQQRAVIAALIAEVRIGPGRRGYNKFDPKRVAFVRRER